MASDEDDTTPREQRPRAESKEEESSKAANGSEAEKNYPTPNSNVSEPPNPIEGAEAPDAAVEPASPRNYDSEAETHSSAMEDDDLDSEDLDKELAKEHLTNNDDAASTYSVEPIRPGVEIEPQDSFRWVKMADVKKLVFDTFSNAKEVHDMFVDLGDNARDVSKKAKQNPSDEDKPKGPFCAPEIRRFEWEDFKPAFRRYAGGIPPPMPPPPSRRGGPPPVTLQPLPPPPLPPPAKPTRPLYVIEVLVDEPWKLRRSGHSKETAKFTMTSSGRSRPMAGTPGSEAAGLLANKTKSTIITERGLADAPNVPLVTSLPARVRIRSRALLGELRELCNGNWSMGANTLVFYRPFKLFAVHKDTILKRYEELKEKFHDIDPETAAARIVEAQSPTKNERFVFIPKKDLGKDAKEDKGNDLAFDMRKITSGEETAATNMNLLVDLHLLCKLFEEDLKPIFELREKAASGTLEKIGFEDMWHLFDYGQEVLISDADEVSVYRVLKFTGGREPKMHASIAFVSPVHKDNVSLDWQDAFHVQVWRLAFDGESYIPEQRIVGIRRYEGDKEITTLPIYPLKFDPKYSKNRQALVQQGRAFERFATGEGRGSMHQTYQGPNLEEDSKGQQIDSEVIIDFQEAFNFNSSWVPKALNPDISGMQHDFREIHEHHPENADCSGPIGCRCDPYHTDYNLDQNLYNDFLQESKHSIAARQVLEGDQDAILLPNKVYGFVLKDRTWAILSTLKDRLHDLDPSDPWQDLVLAPDVRSTVEALVERHVDRAKPTRKAGKSNFGDFIRGKGRGLVFLLHGPPGVGKTSTAECIAAHKGKPLYPLTSGNLGINPDEVEKNLRKHFRLADRWDCILLLDEADVFLQMRFPNQLAINAIVSVFLRQLEYYNGILFLTTNRVGDIDPAFKSRVHVTLEYKPLNRSTTLEIYRLHLRKVAEDFGERKDVRAKVKDREIIEWAEQHYKDSRKRHRQWNGRQIHNAFQTAVALAEWDSKELESEKQAAIASASDVGEKKPKKLVLSKRQFEKVAKVSEGFDQYMKELYQRDEATMARDKQQRMDYRPKGRKASRRDEDSDEDSGSGSGEDNDDDDDDSEDERDNRRKKGGKSGKERGGKVRGKGKGKEKEYEDEESSED